MSAHPLPVQAVRDLAWVLTSPSLIRPIPEARLIEADLNDSTQHWLEQLNRNPAPLLDHLQQRNTRLLGSYFESLWEFWLINQPHLRLIGQRQQIIHQGHTLGEFDILLWDDSCQQFRHQELAVKFFLGTDRHPPPSPHTSESVLWKGPNAHDRLDLKLAKLRNQQLRLGEHPVARQWLRERGIDQLETELLIKGYLFYPLHQPLSPPEVASDHHLRGSWLYPDQLPQLQSRSERWLVLEKAHWLSPAWAMEESLLNFQQLEERVRQQMTSAPRALMIAAMEQAQAAWQESGRYFIVPARWPEA